MQIAQKGMNWKHVSISHFFPYMPVRLPLGDISLVKRITSTYELRCQLLYPCTSSNSSRGSVYFIITMATFSSLFSSFHINYLLFSAFFLSLCVFLDLYFFYVRSSSSRHYLSDNYYQQHKKMKHKSTFFDYPRIKKRRERKNKWKIKYVSYKRIILLKKNVWGHALSRSTLSFLSHFMSSSLA